MSELKEQLGLLSQEIAGEFIQANSNFGSAEKLVECEHKLAIDPDNIEVKLQWIWFQADCGDVPVSALVSPLQEVIAKAIPNQAINLALAATTKIAGMLIAKKQQRLAVSILESANKAQVGEFSNPVWETKIKSILLDLYREESVAALKRREPKSYFDALEKKIAQAETDLKKRKSYNKEVKSEATKSVPDSATKSVHEDILSDQKSEQLIEELKSTFSEKIQHSSSKKISYAVLIILLLAVLYQAQYFLPERLKLTDSAELSAPPIFPTFLATLSPQPKLSDKLAGIKDGVDDRLSKLDDRIKNLNFDSDSADSEIDTTAIEKAEEKIDQEVIREEPVKEVLPRQAEKVEEKNIPGKTPMLDPERLAKRKLEQLGSTIPNNDLRMGPDGRVFGPMTDRGNMPQDVSSFPVEQFDPPRLYKAIVDLKVLSAPSMMSSEVALLRSGSVVQAVAKMDRWLEIRSTGGRKGYIFIQDAEPVR